MHILSLNFFEGLCTKLRLEGTTPIHHDFFALLILKNFIGAF